MSFEGVEVWRGGVNSWEVDEMGHLNVRFYVALATEALVAFAPHLGIEAAFRPSATATLIVREHHIRFLKEARVRAPLYMTAGVLEISETDARLLFVLRHSEGGEPCATFNTLVSHVTAREARPFSWPTVARERAAELMIALPDYAAPRSVTLEPVATQASVTRAVTLGMTRISAGAFGPQDCDVFGRMEAQHFMGRIVSGIPTLSHGFRQVVIEHTEPKPERVGNAAMEYRLVYLGWPSAGDRFEIRTAPSRVDSRGQSLVHWMLDPATGEPWAVSEAYIVTFDLDARKMMRINDAAQAELQAKIAPGISL